MSLRSMINAARSGNAVEFEKHFVNETQERLSAALSARRAQIVGGMFGLSEEVLSEEEKLFIESVLHELSEEDLNIIAEDEEALEMFIEQTLGQAIKKGAKTGAKVGGAIGAAGGAVVGGGGAHAAGAGAGVTAAGAGAGAAYGGAMGAATGAAVGAGVGAVKHGVKKLVNKVRGKKAA